MSFCLPARWWFFLLAGLGLLVSACAARGATVELRDATATVSANGVTSTSTVRLPYHWDRVHRSLPGTGDFEMVFELPEPSLDEAGEPFGMYFARIGNTADIFLNGTLLARLGDTSRPNGDDYAKGPQYVAVPPRMLQRVNTLQVRLRADGGRRGGLTPVLVGPQAQVLPVYRKAFSWRVAASFIVVAMSLIVGFIALALWLTQSDPLNLQVERRDALYLCAGVAEFCWALRVGDVAITQPPLAWPWWGIVATAVFAGWICCIAMFCHHVAGWHRHRSMPWFRAGMWALFGSSIAASFLSLQLHQPAYLTAWLGFANVFFIVYGTAYLWAALRRRGQDRGHLLLALAGILNIAFGVRDWVTIRISGSLVDATWIRYASILFGLVLGYIVITRFRAASAQARDLRANLESRVLLKETELAQTYQRMEALAREQERTAERSRILRDMHDGVGSHISAAIRQLQSGRASSDEVLLTLRDSLDQLKLSIDAIHLPPGDVTALLANLRYRLEPRFAASDIELQWDVDLVEPIARLDAGAMRQLQFMLFEALSNVLQHAQASVLRIEARASGAGCLLRIVDNGRGFDVGQPQRKGLQSMRERARAIDADLSIASEPGRTVVEIRLQDFSPPD